MTTRIYVPTSLTGLARAQETGALELLDDGTLRGNAVTAAVREWYVEGDLEEFEFSALIDAAQASLDVLAQHKEAPRRRAVVAADVADDTVKPSGESRSAVVVQGPIPLSKVVSVHVDEIESESVIEQAVAVLDAAAAGDDDAKFQLDEAEACDLLWYDVSEIDDLIG